MLLQIRIQNNPGLIGPGTNSTDPSSRTVTESNNSGIPLAGDTFTPNQTTNQANKKRGFLRSILYEGFKIGLTIGLSVIASTLLTPIGGMIVGGLVTAAFSAAEQYSEKGKVDWTRVGIEFGLGFASMGVGKVIVSTAGKFLTKALSKPLVHAAVNSSVQGGFTGASLTAYDTHATGGKVNWESVLTSFAIGGLFGGLMGSGMHKVTSRLTGQTKYTAASQATTSQTSTNIPTTQNPTIIKPAVPSTTPTLSATITTKPPIQNPTTSAKPTSCTNRTTTINPSTPLPGERVGQTTIQHIKGKKVVVEVRREISKFDVNEETYFLFIGKRQIGYTKINKCTNSNPNFLEAKQENLTFLAAAKYDNSGQLFKEHVYVKIMESVFSKGKFRGVGTKLHQIAIERSFQINAEGRVALEAAWNSHGFHYKTGFRFRNSVKGPGSDLDIKVANILKQAKEKGIEPDTQALAALQMFLPEEQIALWKNTIMQARILF